ncbi:site-specific integrase [Flavobacterium psychrophilum]|nr:site-specific integrase [Flavobacterium psychrophilum]
MKRPKDAEIINKQTEVNNELNKIERYVLTAFNNINPALVNKNWLQSEINYYYTPVEEDEHIPKNLIDYIEYYIEYRKHELQIGMIKKSRVTKHKLERFQTFRGKPILIKNVNEQLKNEFIDYCKNEKYSQNTIERDLAAIKTFCKHARFIGLETNGQLDSLRMDKTKVDNIYLTFEELEIIENVTLNDSLNNARDWLIISCYTAQRISDFMRFNEHMIRNEGDLTLIEFTQKKTKKIMSIAMHPKVKEIIKKRGGKFPIAISDQKYNEYIKEVCKIAGLNEKVSGSKKTETELNSKIYRKESGIFEKWELITSHIGRRSFATNFYGTGIPTNLLMTATGHSTEKMFLNYIGKGNKDYAKELNSYFNIK